jgi:hypothetical protein
MQSNKTIRVLAVISIILPLTMGCFLTRMVGSFSATQTPPDATQETIQLPTSLPPTEIIPTDLPAEPTPTVEIVQPTKTEIVQGGASHEPICAKAGDLQICFPIFLANNLVVSTVPEVTADNGAPWEVAPEHSVIDVQGYPLSNMFMKPQINIYPLAEYKKISPDEINSQIDLLNTIMAQKPAVLSNIPYLPFVNAAPMILAHPVYYDADYLKVKGFSVITQYGQSFWPINNYSLFYTFQGMTLDGKYWISITLPITQQDLPPTGDYIKDQDYEAFGNNFKSYVAQVREKLDKAEDITFNPSLETFDMVVMYSFSDY